MAQQERITDGTYRHHLRETLRIAWPVVLSQMSHTLVGLADTVFVGQMNEARSLAIISLASSIATFFIVFGVGVSMALSVLVANSLGGGRRHELPDLLTSALILFGFGGVLIYGLSLPLAHHLEWLGIDLDIARDTAPVLDTLMAGLPAVMIFQTLRQWLEGMGKTKTPMIAALSANWLNVGLNYLLIFGGMGIAPRGALGAAEASLIARIVIVVVLVALMATDSEVRQILKGWRLRWRWPMQREMLRIGMPTSLQFVFEVGAFSFAAVLVSRVGVVDLAAHQIAITISSVTYMAASGLAAAGAVRVGFFAEGGSVPVIRKAGRVVILTGSAFMLSMGLILITTRHVLPYLFTQTPEVVELVAHLLIFSAAFQLMDGLQVIVLGALRGLKDVVIPTVLTFIAYWVIAIPLGWWLGLTEEYGAPGIWMGLSLGLTFSAMANLVRYRRTVARHAVRVTLPTGNI